MRVVFLVGPILFQCVWIEQPSLARQTTLCRPYSSPTHIRRRLCRQAGASGVAAAMRCSWSCADNTKSCSDREIRVDGSGRRAVAEPSRPHLNAHD
jgi:hypothetical protein